MTKLTRAFGVGIFLLAAASLVGCPFSTNPTEEPPPDDENDFLPRTSVANLLENLKTAYRERVPAEYESLLAVEYVFIFSDLDQADPDVPSDDLTREDEVHIHENMFDADLVQTLQLDFQYDVGALEVDEEFTTEGDTLWTLTLTNVDLYLYGGTPQHPDEPAGYELEDGVEQLWFKKNSWTDGQGHPIWSIARWKERNTGKAIS